jgi:hypothetical protein
VSRGCAAAATVSARPKSRRERKTDLKREGRATEGRRTTRFELFLLDDAVRGEGRIFSLLPQSSRGRETHQVDPAVRFDEDERERVESDGDEMGA